LRKALEIPIRYNAVRDLFWISSESCPFHKLKYIDVVKHCFPCPFYVGMKREGRHRRKRGREPKRKGIVLVCGVNLARQGEPFFSWAERHPVKKSDLKQFFREWGVKIGD